MATSRTIGRTGRPGNSPLHAMTDEQQWPNMGQESDCPDSAVVREFDSDLEGETASWHSQGTASQAQPSRRVWMCLLVLAAAVAVVGSVSLYLDCFVGVSDNEKGIGWHYPQLGKDYMSIVTFNDSIPNTAGAFYKYVDLSQGVDSRTVTVRKGLFSQCERPLSAVTRVAYVESPWVRTCKADGVTTFFCPVAVVRVGPTEVDVVGRVAGSNGCFSREQRCDGIMDCPSGHDEMGCPNLGSHVCAAGTSQCTGKTLCVDNSVVCDGINDCGLFEDESDCCSVDGFIRCNDGHCVAGGRCDGHPECTDLSDEYNCPVPNDDAYFQCTDGQLVDGHRVCDMGTSPVQPYQCQDLSDETDCAKWTPLPHRKLGPSFDFDARCFKFPYSWVAVQNTSQGSNLSSTISYESVTVRLLLAASYAASVACSWIACFFSWLSFCIRRRLGKAACTLLLSTFALFLCAVAQVGSIVYWYVYVRDANQELTAKQVPILGQVFRETLLALGMTFQFKVSFLMTVAAVIAEILCIVLSCGFRRHYRREWRARTKAAASRYRSKYTKINEDKSERPTDPDLQVFLNDGHGRGSYELKVSSEKDALARIPLLCTTNLQCEEKGLPNGRHKNRTLSSKQGYHADETEKLCTEQKSDSEVAVSASATCNKPRITLLPSVQESDLEGAEDTYVNFTSQGGDAGADQECRPSQGACEQDTRPAPAQSADDAEARAPLVLASSLSPEYAKEIAAGMKSNCVEEAPLLKGGESKGHDAKAARESSSAEDVCDPSTGYETDPLLLHRTQNGWAKGLNDEGETGSQAERCSYTTEEDESSNHDGDEGKGKDSLAGALPDHYMHTRL